MKNKSVFKSAIAVLIAILSTFMLGACGPGGGDNGGATNNEPKTFIVQYADENGTHQITVTSGMPYHISAIPEKTGYEFLGLFDAEVGGTQYISKNGSSLSSFTDNSNIVLYPQFKAKQYTIALDYQGAAVTGERSVVVDYDSTITMLPTNLTLPNKTFQGWFTEPDKGGDKIADAYGVLPDKAKVNERNFDLSDPDGLIKLYAGFAGEMFTVTLYIGNNTTPEELQVEYGTFASDIIPETRVDGKAVVTWATNSDRTDIFNGKITGEKVLYSAEFAPVLDFDSNGGSKCKPIVAKAGAEITLPTPTLKNYTFGGWKTSAGQIVNYDNMPADSVALTAVWQANIVFDENGGTDVADISQPSGTRITLPTPEKDGYIFAGWYTQDKEKYTSTAMPETSVVIKAGWYQSLKYVQNFITSSSSNGTPYVSGRNVPKIGYNNYYSYSYHYTVKTNSFINGSANQNIKVFWHAQVKNSNAANRLTVCFNVYSKEIASDSYLLSHKEFTNIGENYVVVEWTTNISVSGDFTICHYTPDVGGGSSGGAYTSLTDYYCEIEYPDTTQLYL